MKDLDCENNQSYCKKEKNIYISSLSGNGFNISSYFNLLIGAVTYSVKEGKQ